MDVEVKYAVDTDASLVDAYNKANGTSYLAAPAGSLRPLPHRR